MQDLLVQQGIDLMLFGMGTVFVFLTLLVITTIVMSFVVQRFFPELETEQEIPTAGSPAPANPTLIAIIQSAIDQHRKRQK